MRPVMVRPQHISRRGGAKPASFIETTKQFGGNNMSNDRKLQKDATQFTRDANAAVEKNLPFDDRAAYLQVRRGLVAQVQDLVIGDAENPIWSLTAYLDQMEYPPAPPCPGTVNPSLWRMATLNSVAGLFQVVPGIYQVRAFDMSNMTIVEGDEGLILIDPLISTECAQAALDLYRKNVPERAESPVKAVIYTHSHVDHFGGVRGVVSNDDYQSGRVEILAPSGFLEHAVSENVYAGTAMGRRAQYMYGPFLDRGHRGQVDCGLGKNQSTGTISLLAPTIDIETTGQEVNIDGVTIIFQLTPGAEAPAEMNFYFPRYKALCVAENATHNMHNVQTLRGARVRDALAWSKYLNEAIGLFGNQAEVLFAQHHWPVWEQDKVVDFLRKQRDLYRYLNDQTLRLLNKGYTGIEIAETFSLPEGLDQEWSCRGYYGSASHNVKAVYDRYLGWFDGNPSTLNALPPSECAPKYVEAMDGPAAVIEKARKAYEHGEYRWVAQLLTHVVFAYPDNSEAIELQASAFEQLGYQAENATWRNFYLMGAQELRAGQVKPQQANNSPDMIEQLTIDMIFDLLASRLDGPRAATKNLLMNWYFTDRRVDYVVEISNGALSYTAGRQALGSDVSLLIERSALDEILLQSTSLRELMKAGRLEVTRGLKEFVRFFSLLDDADPNFPIVTPRNPSLPSMEATGQQDSDAEDEVLARQWRLAPPLLKGC
jgi:alkyl sulfatase BDS1-like metallo-beta-lactamase superfamily hydrolase